MAVTCPVVTDFPCINYDFLCTGSAVPLLKSRLFEALGTLINQLALVCVASWYEQEREGNLSPSNVYSQENKDASSQIHFFFYFRDQLFVSLSNNTAGSCEHVNKLSGSTQD
jgi:hypothetical protein